MTGDGPRTRTWRERLFGAPAWAGALAIFAAASLLEWVLPLERVGWVSGSMAAVAVAVGVGLGRRLRPREADRAPEPPWPEVVGASLLGMVLAAGPFGWGGGQSVAFGFGATGFGPAVFVAIGALLGAHVRSFGAVSGTAFGWLAWTGLSYVVARWVFWDPSGIASATLVSSLVGAVGVGAATSARLGRLGFPECAGAATAVSFVVFFSVASDPEFLAERLNAPVPQILIAASLLPPVLTSAFFTVGASLGFLAFGGGRFDPGFLTELQVALRYLRAQSRTAVVGAVTVVAILGVCLGVMALIVVLSIMSGFEADLKTKILAAHAHLMVTKHGDDFVEYADVEARAARLAGVESAAAFVLGDAMISTDVGLSGTLVKGLDPARRSGLQSLEESLQQGSVDDLLHPENIPGACPKGLQSRTATVGSGAGAKGPLWLDEPAVLGRAGCGRVLPGIVLGRELSRALRAYVGDVVKLVSPTSDELGPMGPVPKLRKFRVAGIVFTGMYEYDAKFSYLAMEDAQRFFGMRDRATGVELKIADLDETTYIARNLKAALGGEPYVVRDWRDLNRELFSALLLEKIAMFIALTMIVMVASFLIVATLVMIVLQRGKEIAILKSIGATDAAVMKVFVLQGLVVGVGGALLGVAGGVAACWWLRTFGFRLDDRVFYIDKLPVVLDRTQVVVIAVAAVTISYLATIYPALTAARLDPVDGLRDD